MEPLPGRTLQQALDAAGPLPAWQVTGVGLRLIDVLQATHRAGLVHRDVKPGNVHLCGGGRVVLTDFGIASAIDDAAPAAGRFPGTPAYVSPERLDGGDTGPACVLFSLGATLFTAVEAGRPSTGARCSPRSPLSWWTGRPRSGAQVRCARSSKVCSPRTPDGG